MSKFVEDIFNNAIVNGIIRDIKIAQKHGATRGAILLTLSGIDTMAYLNMPKYQKEVKGQDYIEWVDKYLKANKKQPYNYRGIDLYGLRCGALHQYGAVSRLSGKRQCKILSFTQGDRRHRYDPFLTPSSSKLVLLDIDEFINDFVKSVLSFAKEITINPELQKKVKNRLQHVFCIKPLNKTK